MRNSFKIIISLMFSLQIAGASAFAQNKQQIPSKENLEAREWFKEARFGMFIHWGLYSYLGGGGTNEYAEWIQNRDFISGKDYKKFVVAPQIVGE